MEIYTSHASPGGRRGVVGGENQNYGKRYGTVKGAFLRYLKLCFGLYRDRRTPFIAKALLWLALLYVIWPLDLIPDFIPLLGQIDDLIVVVVFLLLAVWLIPPALYDEHYARVFGASHHAGSKTNSYL